MANTDVEVLIKLKDELSKGLSNVNTAIKGTNSKFNETEKLVNNLAKGMGILTLAAAGVATAFGVSCVKSFEESMKLTKQLEAVLKSTGGVAGVTEQAALDLANSFQKLSTFSDEEVLTAENMLLTFTNIGKNVFPEATQAVLDMSVALGADLQGTAIQVGKALQDPILGVTALRRVGVNFNEEQQKMIKNLVETGRSLEAQKYILKELATEFGGSALIQTQTFSGQIALLKNQFDNLKEGIGKVLVEQLTVLLAKFREFDWEGWTIKIGAMATQFFNSVMIVIQPALLMLQGAWVGLQKELAKSGISLGSVAKTLTDVVAVGLYIVITGVAGVITIFTKLIQMRESIMGFFNSVKASIDSFTKSLQTLYKWLVDVLNKINQYNTINIAKKVFGGGKAVGGLVNSSQTYLVGERGPELFSPPTSGTITPNSRLGSSGGGNTININVDIGMYAGSTMEKRNIGKELYQALVDLAQSKNLTVAELMGA